MSTAKTQVNQDQLESFFHDHLHLPEAAYQTVADGELSQAYFYETPEGERVLRINSQTQEGFLKDQYAADHFPDAGIPVPKILETGELEPGMFFSISERVPGQTLDKLSAEEMDSLMPEIIKTVDAIHSIPPMGEGFGYWQLDGSGKYTSWRETLAAMQVADDDDKLPGVDFFDQALHDQLKAKIDALLTYCPEERVLLHADFGFNNTLSDGKSITGVIDWHGSMYGDPLFDVAWLDFWGSKQGYAARFRQYYESRGRLPAHFDERIKCYSLLTGMGSLAFFAKSGQPEKYEFAKNRVFSISD